VSGAFNGLANIVRKRIGAKSIGFLTQGGRKATPKDENYLASAKSVDFIEFGFESEFVGRLPVIVNCQELGVEDLFQILKHSEGSIIRQYVQAFEAYGIELTFTDGGLHRLAEIAYLERTGARSLIGVCERTFREFKYHLPHSGLRKLELTAELVNFPLRVLERVLSQSAVIRLKDLDSAFEKLARDWSQRYGIALEIQPEALRILSQKAIDSDMKPEDVFTQTFKNYEHGLNLIRERQGVGRFEITPEVVKDPQATLDHWIRNYYVADRS
jgi:hypothetical protein